MTGRSSTDDTWPTELRLADRGAVLTVAFDDGFSCRLEAEYLRVKSPSAEVQGHSEAERKTVPGKRQVRITEVEPIGNYAVRLTFDDGHATGIYSWAYLRKLGAEHDRLWADYLRELAAKNLSREPNA